MKHPACQELRNSCRHSGIRQAVQVSLRTPQDSARQPLLSASRLVPASSSKFHDDGLWRAPYWSESGVRLRHGPRRIIADRGTLGVNKQHVWLAFETLPSSAVTD